MMISALYKCKYQAKSQSDSETLECSLGAIIIWIIKPNLLELQKLDAPWDADLLSVIV